jgi:outer membrane protein assembly factor BamB/enterochelin esterase-like enzyme
MRPLGTLLALVASCSFAVADDDWPGLRGPRHDGGAVGKLEATDGAGFAVAWRAALGSGYSSVAVAGGRAVTLFSDGTNDVAAAFDSKSGRELWRSVIAPTLVGKDGSFDGPIATPALAGNRVFGLGPRGHLFALDAATGRELWKVDLVERETSASPHYGFSSTPLVAGGVVVVQLGAKAGGALGGFDPATGTRRWRVGDGGVAYQSPVVLSVGGRGLVVAASNTKLAVVDPQSGRVLLEHEHGGEPHPMGAESIVPVPAGDGRVFLKHRQDVTTMLRLVPEGDGLRVETLWSAPVLRGTYLIPVYHAGFLYGMSGRITLTCVDAATGALRWRSREPGDGFPLLVGDDLVVLTKERTLHVAKASPEGWAERARIELFKDVVWSPPGFAEGAVFAHSQGELARVEWRVPEGKSEAPAAAAPRPASMRLRHFLDELSAAQDKPAAVDRFLASISPGPLVDGPDRVVFLYRGAAADAGIVGDMNGDRREDPMWRAPGTDLFWYEATLEPDARVNYHFVRDFEERLPDPRNPWRVPGHASGSLGQFPKEQSSLAMPGWIAPDHLGEAEASRRGRLDEHVVTSATHTGTTVALKVYVPAGYDQGTGRLPVALVLDGDAALEQGLLARSLDNLIPQRVAPVLVAFLGYPKWGVRPPSGDEEEEALAEVLVKDVVAFLDGRYRTDSAREQRAVIGSGFFGHRAASVVFRRPAVFGALGLQSLIMLETNLLGSSEGLLRKVAPQASEAPLRIYLDWGLYDRRATREAWDMGTTNARFAAFLRERGYKPAGGRVPEGSGWAGWRNRTDRVFGALFAPAGGTP